MTLPLSETQRQELTLTVAAVMESVNEFAECIPLLAKEGWLRHQEDAAKPPYEGADGEGVNELQERVFPSSERRGGCAIKKMLRSLLMKAQTGWSVPDNVTTSTFTIMTTPSAPLRRF